MASIKTSAVRKGDDLVINGKKMWITNSLQVTISHNSRPINQEMIFLGRLDVSVSKNKPRT